MPGAILRMRTNVERDKWIKGLRAWKTAIPSPHKIAKDFDRSDRLARSGVDVNRVRKELPVFFFFCFF